jgi:ABC-type arginine/histidine transport system permease subunit
MLCWRGGGDCHPATLSRYEDNKIFFLFYKLVVYIITIFNLLKPTGYLMNHQFNIQQLYALLTLYLCVLYLSKNKQRLVPLTA